MKKIHSAAALLIAIALASLLNSTWSQAALRAVAGVINQASVAITGGTINGTTVGATTPAAGTFTTLNSTSTLTAGPLTVSTGATANQVRTAQTTPPTCSSNCGTGTITVVGTDTAGIVTMGTTGSPTSGWVLTFNGTWPTQGPACIVTAALSSMATGKKPIAVQTNQTTMTVTTDGTGPGNSDQYAYHCIGVS